MYIPRAHSATAPPPPLFQPPAGCRHCVLSALVARAQKVSFFVPRFSVYSCQLLSTPCATMGLRFCCAAASRVSTAVTAAEFVSKVVSSFALAVATPAVMHAQVCAFSCAASIHAARTLAANIRITRGSAPLAAGDAAISTNARWLAAH